jgi:hypothetical protein
LADQLNFFDEVPGGFDAKCADILLRLVVVSLDGLFRLRT